MKKLLLVLLLVIPLVGSAKMFPTEFPIKSVCWNDVDEAITYHQEVLGEYPIGKGWIDNKPVSYTHLTLPTKRIV